MSVVVKQVFQVRQQLGKLRPGLYRVVLVAPREGVVCLYQMGSAGEAASGSVLRRPINFPLAVLNHAFEKQHQVARAQEIAGPTATNANRERMDKHDRFKRNMGILQPLVEPDTMFRMLVSNCWNTELALAAKAQDVSPHTVARLICRYFFVGLDLREACRPNFWVKGVRRAVKGKLGRPHDRLRAGHCPAVIGRNTSDEDRHSIEIFYNTLEDQSISVAQMYRDYETVYRPVSVAVQPGGKLQVQSDEQEAFISERQFRYSLKQVKGDLELLLKTVGERKNNLRHRVALGSARDRVPYPGHTYIIDATVADVYLVSAFDRRRIIGRPVIYVVIDAFSSLIVSVHVGLLAPSFEQARIAMFRALTDKSRWLQWLGLGKLAKWLPQGCRPTFWLADRGELHSVGSYEMQLKLETSLSLAAAYRADWKSIVERNFGTLNSLLIHWVPGAVRERVRERGTADPRLDAVLTLKEFTRLVVRMAAILNFDRDMSRHMSAPLIAHDVSANPVGFWKWGVENIHGSATFLSYEECVRATLPKAEGNVTRRGVLLGEDRYVAEWMREHQAMQLAGHGVHACASMYASPDEPGVAWCALASETGLRETRLHTDRQIGANYSLEDILEVTAVRKFTGQDLADDMADERVELQRENKLEIAAAKQLAKDAHAAGPMSKSARTSDISENRRQELASHAPPPLATASGPLPVAQVSESPPQPVAQEPGSAATVTPTSASENDDYFSRLATKLGDWTTS